MKKMMKKLIAMAAALVMIVTLLPAVGVKAETTDTIDLTTKSKGTITIQKKTEDKKPLGGAGFTLYTLITFKQESDKEVVVDISHVQGINSGDSIDEIDMNLVRNLTTGGVQFDKEEVGPTEATGDVQVGESKFTDVPAGIYLVKETTTPEGYVASSPFIISMPSTDNYNNDDKVGTKYDWDIIAEPKNMSQTISKEVTSDKTVGIGEDVDYKITTQIPVYGSEYTNPVFNVYDTLSEGLTFNDDIIVKVAGTTLNEDTDYKVYTGEEIPEKYKGKTFVVEFQSSYLTSFNAQDNIADRSVEITYSAEVNEDAVYENGNEAGMTYQNAPGESIDKDYEPDVNVYTFGIDLTKLGQDEDVNGLNGAKFTLTEKETNETVLSFIVNGNKEVLVTEGSEMTTATYNEKNGKLVIWGIPVGKYVLKETEAPAKYTKYVNPIEIEIVADEDGSFKEAIVDNATYDAGDVVDGMVPVEVQNQKGFSLPETGGMGTYLFTIGGIVIMAGAAFALIAMKKRA